MSLSASGAGASGSSDRGALALGVETGARTFDALSASDVRPQPRGEAIAGFEAGYALSKRWGVAVSGRFGGAWFDFSNGGGASGKIEDDSWSVRAFFDRHVRMAEGRGLRFGLGYQYGEARSWVKNFVPVGVLSRYEGPHAFMSGGAFRSGVAQSLGSRCELSAELEESVYNAHATDPRIGNKYDWLGRAFSATVGIRVVLIRGREE
jgi:hypothetical protein